MKDPKDTAEDFYRHVMDGVPAKPMTFEQYVPKSQSGDLLLWEPRGWYSKYIAVYTDGPFSHVTAVADWESVGQLMSVGYDEKRGGVATPLRTEVARWPNKIHVFRVCPNVFAQAAEECQKTIEQVRHCVTRRLCSDLGWEYAWGNIRLISRGLLPFVRLFTGRRWHKQLIMKASQNTKEGICSQHVFRSYAACGIEFLHKPAAVVTPNDLARSYATCYFCTLSSVEETGSVDRKLVW